MPNWCSTNYLLKGSEKDIRRFCDTVNSCLDKPDVKPNGFGKYWLGNLCVAFGDKYDDNLGGLRGHLVPNPDEPACFFGSSKEAGVLTPEEESGDWIVGFSVVSAWSVSDWFNNMLEEKFPDVEVGWKATDEFGNFHITCNSDLIGCPVYELETCGDADSYVTGKYGDEEIIARILSDYTGEIFTAAEILQHGDDLDGRLAEYNDKEENEDRQVYLTIWEETSF